MGSRDWISNDKRSGLHGEYDGPVEFDQGLPPPSRPEVRLIGDRTCIGRGGGGNDLTSSPEGMERWLPAGCYQPATTTPSARMRRCPDMAQIAKVLADVYYAPDSAVADAQALVGAGSVATLYRYRDGDVFSSSLVCILGNEVWTWIDGTRNAGQLLMQAYDSRFGGRDYGSYSASPIYHAYATECLWRISRSGGSACTRMVFVGHSYGGAAAAVAAARAKLLYPDRSVYLFTEGAPRAGGSKLIDALREVDQIHFARPHDPIPWLPPQFGLWSGWAGITIPFLSAWGEYAQYQNRKTIDAGTLRDELPEDAPDNTDVQGIAAQIAANIAVTGFEDHDSRRYANNFATHCGLSEPFVILPSA